MESPPQPAWEAPAWVAVGSLSRVKELQGVLRAEGIDSQLLPPPEEQRG